MDAISDEHIGRRQRHQEEVSKLSLLTLKGLPSVMGLCYCVDMLTSYFGWHIALLSYFAETSLLFWVYMLVASHVFRFCLYHRLPLYYILACDMVKVSFFVGLIPQSVFKSVCGAFFLVGVCLLILIARHEREKHGREHEGTAQAFDDDAGIQMVGRLLYPFLLGMLRYIPALAATFHFVVIVLGARGMGNYALNYVSSLSFAPLVFVFLSSWVFGFPAYHRTFLLYILTAELTNAYYYYFGLPLSDDAFLTLHLFFFGLFIAIIFYQYARNHQKTPVESH